MNAAVARIFTQKLCLVGDFGVGKTSLIRRFVDRSFSDQYLSTLGVKISRKTLVLAPVTLNLVIWDIEGSTRFKEVAPSYLQGASGAVLVGDLSRIETLHNLRDHVALYQRVNPKGIMAIALNKADLMPYEQVIQWQQYLWSAHPQMVCIMPTSARTGAAVDETFHQLSQHMIQTALQ
ncbi:MAG: GTP-binding protein [Oscillatoriales cyanobacterium SM2_2_1]|nr:GTP-binding protein [Oscillatoriales cyanobacterium SM2_2_1]